MATPIIIFLLSLSVRIGLFNQILKASDCFLLISVLTALLGTDHGLSSGQVDGADTGLHLIDILATLAAATEGVEDNLLRIELFDLGDGSGTEVNDPVLALMLRLIQASTYSLA